MEKDKVIKITLLAIGFTFLQMFVSYVLLTLKLFGRYNVFLAYRKIFESMVIFDKIYFLFVAIMNKIFGLSYLYVAGFNNVFKLTFFTIFILNIFFLFFLFRKKEREEVK